MTPSPQGSDSVDQLLHNLSVDERLHNCATKSAPPAVIRPARQRRVAATPFPSVPAVTIYLPTDGEGAHRAWARATPHETLYPGIRYS